jgi:hypothetical protein
VGVGSGVPYFSVGKYSSIEAREIAFHRLFECFSRNAVNTRQIGVQDDGHSADIPYQVVDRFIWERQFLRGQ